MMRLLKILGLTIAAGGVLAVSVLYGASWYYTSQHGAGCASCHEMTAYASAMHGSAHRNATCLDCHEASFSAKLRHIRVHVFGELPDAVRLRDVDVVEMTASCQRCHQREYATWNAGPHSVTYSRILTDPVHNAKRHLNDGCLRCHGMHFNGGIRDLVQPQNTAGPWRLTRADLAGQPAIPCMACHQLHREGAPEAKSAVRISVSGATMTHSLAFFDRREQMHFSAAVLSLPRIWDGPRVVKVSPDARQALCYQCHAPRRPDAGTVAATNHWGTQAGSGDDRTPLGVHEGISCLACHLGHNENVRASCKTCHPQMSHCGLDVETMDTTYSNDKSSHNIHWVRCADCHQHGVPKMKMVARAAAQHVANGD